MLRLAVFFFLVSIVSGLLGFAGLSGAAAGMAKFFFGAFLLLAVLFVVLGYTVFKKISA